MNIMEEDPIQLTNDELGCPRCKIQLVEGKSSYYFQRVKVGSFESLRCEFCGYFILTENGFKESTKAIARFGLSEPQGEVTTVSVDTALQLFYPNISETHSTLISTEEKKQETLADYSEIVNQKIVTTPLLITSEFRFSKK